MYSCIDVYMYVNKQDLKCMYVCMHQFIYMNLCLCGSLTVLLRIRYSKLFSVITEIGNVSRRECTECRGFL